MNTTNTTSEFRCINCSRTIFAGTYTGQMGPYCTECHAAISHRSYYGIPAPLTEADVRRIVRDALERRNIAVVDATVNYDTAGDKVNYDTAGDKVTISRKKLEHQLFRITLGRPEYTMGEVSLALTELGFKVTE